MSENSHDTGVITVMLERLNSQRLPRALALKEKVDNGERINDFDIAFLDEVFADIGNIIPELQYSSLNSYTCIKRSSECFFKFVNK